MVAFLFFATSAALAVGLFLEYRRRTHAERQLADVAKRARDLEQHAAQLAQQVNVLSRYQSIVDAESYAAQLRATAETEFQRVRAQANAEHEQAQHASRSLRDHAAAERAQILTEAQAEARRIAGDAYETAARAKELEKTVRALENVIEGYGDKYLVPDFQVLDELAEGYGHTEAGRELKKAVTEVRTMMARGQAAHCDYVEANRKSTATAFVLDAFNGKVDSILAAVRHDNYGTLAQKIHDAYQLVNHLGEAFRNARILSIYRDAQLQLLKWTVVVQQLRQREKEEQRALREQMREEEKARREFERAMKEAARDEEVARKALEKARQDLAQASDAQRAKYEAKLEELAERLRLAEEKGKRAISMAQQTRAGNVYVISNVGSFGDGVLKIGMTRRLDPLDRVKELGDASVPFEFDVHAMIRSEDAPGLEKQLHKLFVRNQVNKVNVRKEFFRVGVADVRGALERMGTQASWTMAAQAREWRESLVMEERMRNDAAAERQWIDQQIREHDRVVDEDVTELAAEEAVA